jgi:glycosyltransferase involved in cell wall biosynthesis
MALRQHLDLPRIARRLGASLMHYPHFDAPVLWQPAPVVVTLHDAKYLLHPEFFPRLGLLKRTYMRFCFAQSLRRAAAVLVDSASTAADLSRLFPVPLSRMRIIYPAADPRFQRASATAVATLRQRYALARPFILCVGERRPHKNHTGLIRAYAASRSRQTHDLVIIGQAYEDYSEPEAVAQQLGLSASVRLFSDVAYADLVAFYTAAELFALVSLYEGFGLPIVEAMACGLPVLTSATTAAGEVAGAGGVTVDPHDTAAIAAAMDNVLQDPAFHQVLVQRGAARRQDFSWPHAAEQTLTIYRCVLDGTPLPALHSV